MRQTVLIVGGGAREHALAWKLRQSSDIGQLLVAPGNAGTAGIVENVPVSATDLPGLLRLVEERDVALTVVGPEAPLALGLADRLRACGRRVVGPDASAARIESSKAFGKDVMARAGVPTARHAVFDDAGDALSYLDRVPYPVVVKADGLAAGKGVVVCANREEARIVVSAMMLEGIHGSAGARVIVEDMLRGPEVSLFALVDGEHVRPLLIAQDHKRLGDGDTGPNTGGMGAYAPVPFLDTAGRDALCRMVIDPVVSVLAAEGSPFRGILFAGLMLTADGPKVLEYNCRLGDPEAQVLLPLIDGDLLPYLEAVADGSLSGAAPVPVLDRTAVGVVLAAPGYPDRPRRGMSIEGLDLVAPDVCIFHAGTRQDRSGQVVVDGGRVLTVVGSGSALSSAALRAYEAPVRFEGMQRRTDIGRAAYGLPPPYLLPASGGTQRHRRRSPVPPRRSPSGGGQEARIGVLVSGAGSNLQALLDACSERQIDGRIAVVISSRPDAGALDRAKRAGVPALALPLSDRHDPVARRRWETQLTDLLASYNLDLVVLAGWMLILSEDCLRQCPAPLLNVHPALLPADDGPGRYVLPAGFPVLRGAHAVRAALDLRLSYTGVSVHYVTPQLDAGPVLLSEPVPIEGNDNEETLYRRIKLVEHQLLPRAIQSVLNSRHYTGGIDARNRNSA